jgi:hypothetical protein
MVDVVRLAVWVCGGGLPSRGDEVERFPNIMKQIWHDEFIIKFKKDVRSASSVVAFLV